MYAVIGKNYNIQWRSYDCHTYNSDGTIATYCTVKIELTRNGGSSWVTIATGVSTTDDGTIQTYKWTVTGGSSINCLIKITSEIDGTILDLSDSAFTIYIDGTQPSTDTKIQTSLFGGLTIVKIRKRGNYTYFVYVDESNNIQVTKLFTSDNKNDVFQMATNVVFV